MSDTADLSELLARVALKDRSALDTLYHRTSAKLFGVLLRLLRDRADAEDVLQEVFIRIWQKADRFSAGGASPMTWLIAVARNLAIDRLRGRKASTTELEEAGEIADPALTPEEQAEADGERGRLDHCLGTLEDDKAAAIRGAYLDGLTYQALAERYNIPLNTMRTWLRRSLMKLKACLEA